jgi:hypothetical protein
MHNQLFCLGLSNGNLIIIDISKVEPTPLTSFTDHDGEILAIFYDKDSKLLLSTDETSIIARLLPFE